MKPIYLIFTLLLINFGYFSQNVGINQSNPSNSLHISPVILGSDPLRIDGIQSYTLGSGDTSLLMINNTTGIVKYINKTDFISIISAGAGLGTDDQNIDSLTLSGLTLTTFIENGSSANVDLSSVSDSAINYLIHNSDTLFTNSSFIDSIISIVNNNTDTLFSNQTFIDSITSLIYTNADTLLSNSIFINNLRDSIDTDIDRVTLVGTTLTIYENGDSVFVDLSSLSDNDADPTNELQTISESGNTVTLSNGGGSFTDTDTHLTESQVDAFANNNGYLTSFTEVDGSITNELQTISESGNTVTLSNGGGSFTDTDTKLTEAQVDAYANNNGYLTSFTEVDGSITNELQTISESGNTVTLSNGGGSFTDTDTHLTESQVDAYANNNGYLTSYEMNVNWVEGTTDVSTSSTTFVNMPNMSTSITTNANSVIEVNFQTATDNNCTDCWHEFRLLIDGQIKSAGPYNHNAKAVWEQTVNSISLYNVGSGTHTIIVQWKVGRFGSTGSVSNKAASESNFGHVRRLIVKELK